jgi:hypothetical protein
MNIDIDGIVHIGRLETDSFLETDCVHEEMSSIIQKVLTSRPCHTEQPFESKDIRDFLNQSPLIDAHLLVETFKEGTNVVFQDVIDNNSCGTCRSYLDRIEQIPEYKEYLAKELEGFKRSIKFEFIFANGIGLHVDDHITLNSKSYTGCSKYSIFICIENICGHKFATKTVSFIPTAGDIFLFNSEIEHTIIPMDDRALRMSKSAEHMIQFMAVTDSYDKE